ncbi:CDP-diacylglycerol---serine O-phosphatidyltransferase [Ruminococcaceae bacterium YRB3002]|nr:CDP-diacylglycerol---serine O-phosphatidyltransferase [Ruminococcaceae bacterium YRB3002]
MIIGKWNRSVILTYLGMVSAVFGMYLALVADKVNYAYACLMIAGVCDLFDGAVARKVKRDEEEKAFGVQLDSLVDVMSFIALPVTIFVASGLKSIWFMPLFALFAISGIARLAYFNIMTADSEQPIRYYTGLPVTYSALIFPVVNLIGLVADELIYRIVYVIAILAVAVLGVMRISIVKPRGIAYVFFGLLAIGMLILYLVVL